MHLTFCIYSFLTLFNFYSSTCTDDVIQWYRPSRALNLSYVLAAYEGTIFTNTIPPFLSGVEEVDSLNLSDDDNISSIQKKADRISFPSTPSIRSYRHPSEFRTVHKRKFSVSPTSFIETNLKQKNKKSSENLNLISENQVYHLLPQDSNQVWIYVLKREISSIPLIFYQAFNCLIFISLSGYFSILGLTKWKWYLFFCTAFSTFTLTNITLSSLLPFYPYTFISLSLIIVIILTNFSTTPIRLPFKNLSLSFQNHSFGWIVNVFMSAFILFNIIYSLLLCLVSVFINKNLLLTFYSSHELSSYLRTCAIKLLNHRCIFTSYVTLSCFVFLFNLSFYRPKLLHYVPTIDGSIGTLQIPLSPSLFFHPVCGIFTDIRYISLVVLLLLVTMFNTAIQQKHLPYTMTATPGSIMTKHFT
ncbi:uncharacterized protein LOC128883131 isoform X3 [Hylaeus volcanicus]|uniref:uncharacterized protein LOC128883131 isoform X3 n=1 Tax=Hylaeus volcanicus TaxID=313075 RepID=UPI0023B7F334|nr:uncharacterized protein LOC128883131 isoform X3 [Hylaeus volcanicus]